MYCFSNNRADIMQENDPIIVNQEWRSLLLNVVHWNIYGEILLNQMRRKKETFWKHLALFCSPQLPGVVSLIEYILTEGSACFSSHPNIGTEQIISLLWSTLTRSDVECWLGILHLSLWWMYRWKHKVVSALWVAAKSSLCSGFFLYLTKHEHLRSSLEFYRDVTF